MRGQGALMVFAVLAADTGAFGADAPKVAELDACSLIAPAAVTAVTGGTIDKSERNDSGETNEGGGYSSTCIWKIDGLPKVPAKEGAPEPFGGAPFAMLNTIVWPAGSGLAKKYVNDFRDAAKQNLIDATPIPVKAGDDALFWGDGVAVAKGDISFGVSVHVGTDKKAEQAMEEALAKKIVSKL
jgi:hypothetical protein